MIENEPNIPPKKRTMKKVRTQFLYKVPDEAEASHPAIPRTISESPVPITEEDAKILNASIGLIETKGKIRLAAHFLNTLYDVTGFRIESHTQTKAVTLNLKAKESKVPEPWEKVVKRLEETQKPELMNWAELIRKHHVEYPNIMARYFETLKSSDPKVHQNLAKIKHRASLARRDLESKFNYFKFCLFCRRDIIIPLSLTYTDGLLTLLGHTIETFVPWAEKNGLPSLTAGDTSALLEISKGFLEFGPLLGKPVFEGPEFDTYLFNTEGCKVPVKSKFIGVVEPVAEGIFVTGFYVQKKGECELEFEKENDDGVSYRELFANVTIPPPPNLHKAEISESCPIPQFSTGLKYYK